jgi:hypothetical protein
MVARTERRRSVAATVTSGRIQLSAIGREAAAVLELQRVLEVQVADQRAVAHDGEA